MAVQALLRRFSQTVTDIDSIYQLSCLIATVVDLARLDAATGTAGLTCAAVVIHDYDYVVISQWSSCYWLQAECANTYS